jgi:hypothetical protein
MMSAMGCCMTKDGSLSDDDDEQAGPPSPLQPRGRAALKETLDQSAMGASTYVAEAPQDLKLRVWKWPADALDSPMQATVGRYRALAASRAAPRLEVIPLCVHRVNGLYIMAFQLRRGVDRALISALHALSLLPHHHPGDKVGRLFAFKASRVR